MLICDPEDLPRSKPREGNRRMDQAPHLIAVPDIPPVVGTTVVAVSASRFSPWAGAVLFALAAGN